MKLIILRGLPGSGKTTLAKFLQKEIAGSVEVSADDYFTDKDGNYNFSLEALPSAHSYCRHAVENSMKNKVGTIFLHNTNTTTKELKPYLDMAEQYGYIVVSLIVKNRHGNKDIHNVPEETLGKMRDRFNVKLC